MERPGSGGGNSNVNSPPQTDNVLKKSNLNVSLINYLIKIKLITESVLS